MNIDVSIVNHIQSTEYMVASIRTSHQSTSRESEANGCAVSLMGVGALERCGAELKTVPGISKALIVTDQGSTISQPCAPMSQIFLDSMQDDQACLPQLHVVAFSNCGMRHRITLLEAVISQT